MSVGVNVNFGALKNHSELDWKSPGNLFLKKGMNPDTCIQVFVCIPWCDKD